MRPGSALSRATGAGARATRPRRSRSSPALPRTVSACIASVANTCATLVALRLAPVTPQLHPPAHLRPPYRTQPRAERSPKMKIAFAAFALAVTDGVARSIRIRLHCTACHWQRLQLILREVSCSHQQSSCESSHTMAGHAVRDCVPAGRAFNSYCTYCTVHPETPTA
jgi:hypothetical protein